MTRSPAEANDFDDDDDMMDAMGDDQGMGGNSLRKPQNIQEVVRMLADNERHRIAKEKADKKTLGVPPPGSIDPKKLKNGLRPIDMLKDCNFRRTVQACFKSQTREDRDFSYKCHTNPPDVGKYSPGYKRVWYSPPQQPLSKEHNHIGSMR